MNFSLPNPSTQSGLTDPAKPPLNLPPLENPSSKRIKKKRMGFLPKAIAFLTFGGATTAGLIYSGALESMGGRASEEEGGR